MKAVLDACKATLAPRASLLFCARHAPRSSIVGDVAALSMGSPHGHAVAARLQVERAIFVGHSMGGYDNMLFYHTYPQYVHAMVLYGAPRPALLPPERRDPPPPPPR